MVARSRTEGLPVHGFVLAGGKSSRMGRDKALLSFRGRPMVEIASEKVRSFCAEVSVAGNREDLARFAPVVRETRLDVGPVAGIEAGLLACVQPWALFVPVDVPLVPGGLLQRWAEAVIEKSAGGCVASFLLVNGDRQPAFCTVHRAAAGDAVSAIDRGVRKIEHLLYALDEADHGWLWPADAARFAEGVPDRRKMELWFSNVNTPLELAEAEAWALETAEEADPSATLRDDN